jgi:hypothetical protein
MLRHCIIAVGLLALAALSTFAAPVVNFPECPAVGADTSGCELLITVTAARGMPGVGSVATAFTVTTSNPDQGSYDGGDGTLIGVLNATSGSIDAVFFTVAPGTGSFAFDRKGACEATGLPLVDIYSPAPTAAQCLQGQYQTIDAFDYASAGVTFLSFNLADAGVLLRSAPSVPLASGASTWFSLPGDIAASQITMVTPEPTSFVLIVTGFGALYFVRRRKLLD